MSGVHLRHIGAIAEAQPQLLSPHPVERAGERCALISALAPSNRNRSKASPQAQPASGDLGDSILRRFREHQHELARRVRALPPELDPRRVTVTSPLSRLMTYSLDDALTVLVVHGRRHLAQAERVTAAEGFPGG